MSLSEKSIRAIRPGWPVTFGKKQTNKQIKTLEFCRVNIIIAFSHCEPIISKQHWP